MQNTSWPCATSHSISERPRAEIEHVPAVDQRRHQQDRRRELRAARARSAAGATCSRSTRPSAASCRRAAGPSGARLQQRDDRVERASSSAPSSRVERLEAVAQPLVDRLAAQLERRGERAVLDGERRLGDEVALDRLVARELVVDRVDALRRRGASARRAARRGAPTRRRRGTGARRRRRRRARSPDRRRTRLDVRGRDVLAAGGDEDVLLAIDDLEEAVVGPAADVAGPEPAVVGERRGGRVRILEVAGEHVLAAREDLAVVGELELDRGQRLADRVEAERVGAVERQRRRRLGEAVALDDRARRQRGAAP